MLRTVALVVAVLALLYAGVCLATYLRQRQLIYFPTATMDVADLEAMWVDSAGERIKLWPLNPGREHAIVYFGGNAEQVLYNREPFETQFTEHSVYLVNYRGYGGSSGEPGEPAFHADGLNVFDAVASGHASVSVIGRSIGSAVATYVAARRPVANLVLVTPMDSIEAIAQHHYPLLPVSLLLEDRYRAVDSAPRVTARTLMVIAGADDIVPLPSSRRLAAALTAAPLTVTVLEQAGHNNIGSSPNYIESIRAFFITGREG